MKVEKNKVVTFYYTLSEEDGTEVENNHSGTPMAYLQGYGNILPALEEALEGLELGEEKTITLPPEKAYGNRRENATQKVPIKHLVRKYKRLLPGTIVKVNAEKGALDARVIKAGKFMVTLDLNHPFAGKTLIFDVQIKEIRDASSEEISHGHAHGLGGHNH